MLFRSLQPGHLGAVLCVADGLLADLCACHGRQKVSVLIIARALSAQRRPSAHAGAWSRRVCDRKRESSGRTGAVCEVASRPAQSRPPTVRGRRWISLETRIHLYNRRQKLHIYQLSGAKILVIAEAGDPDQRSSRDFLVMALTTGSSRGDADHGRGK